MDDVIDQENRDYQFLGIKESPRQTAYRNKMEFSFGDEFKDGPLALGMHKRGSFYDIVTVENCQIVDEDFRKILSVTLAYFREKNITYYHKLRHTGYLRHLLVRKAVKTGEILVDLVTTTQTDIPGIAGIDTRALTKILREKGTMNGMITVDENYDLDTIIPRLKAYTTGKVVEKVSCREKEVLKGNGPKVALLDLGAKKNIARSLNERGCQVTIYPALTSAEEILGDNPDGIMLSNGPGDPKECTSIIKEIKKLYDSDVPIFAICLGHQLMALATGGDTHKMKYGHRGGNHPVKDLATGRVYISSQNHGYVVDAEGLEEKNIAKPAFVNVNDGTNEGMAYEGKNIFTVQFHPEACPGPQDSSYLFDRFMDMMGGNK